MANRFVRASKYRHVFGRPTKREQCYDNLRISKNAWDTNLIKANPEYLSVNWEAGGGGAFAVIPLNEKGKLPDQLPLFRGHTAPVLDTDWSPFDDSFLASSSDDGKVLLWKVPEGFSIHQDPENIKDVAPVSKLSGHSRKVGHVLFNPSAQNILASSSGDYTIKLWDVEAGSSKLTLTHKDIVQSMSWSANGSLLVTTCRDKKLRIWDVRQEKPAVEVAGHSGAKNSRAVWLGEHDRIATTGFSKMSDRQMGLWDVRAAQAGPIDGFTVLDQISGVCMPFWDDGTQCLYLAGKGDGNIRYYEYENDRFEYLSQYSSAEPQRGFAFLPKRGVNLHENEVVRAYKTLNDSTIEPISFIVPRRAEVFQDDIYPPTVGKKPAMSAGDWFGGKEGLPPKISLESVYEGDAPQEVPSDYKPSAPLQSTQSTAPPSPKAASTPTPTRAAAALTKTEPEPEQEQPKHVSVAAAVRSPPPTASDNKASMSNMASRFADKDEEESSDDEPFEEIPKPVSRASLNGSTATSSAAKPESTKAISPPVSKSVSPPPSAASTAAPEEPPAASEPASTAAPRTTAAEGLKATLQEIKAMLESQGKQIMAQAEQITALTKEVETLKAA